MAWHVGDSPHLCYHLHKSRKRGLVWAMKSPPSNKPAWADIVRPKFSIACPKFILIDIAELILDWFFQLYFLKLVSAIFYQIFIYHQMIALQKIWKMFFISSKKLFSFSRYSSFCIFIFPSFSLSAIALSGWSKKNLEVYDTINCISKNLILFDLLRKK